MDYERILCELFPQIDARLIKAILLDGDDLESAVDFLVKEVLRSDAMKSDHVLVASKDSLQPSANHSNDINASSGATIDCSDEAAHIHCRTEMKLADDCQTEGLGEVNCDKQEESIVWLGGQKNYQLLNSVDDPPLTDRPMILAELQCENSRSLSSGLLQQMNQLYVNQLEEEIISFRSNCSLGSNDYGHSSEKHDREVQGSTDSSEQNTTFIPVSTSLQVHNFLPFSERLGFHSPVSQQQQARTQQLQPSDVATGGLLIDLEQQPLQNGQLEDLKLTDVGLPVSENSNNCKSPAALVEHSEIQEEASAPVRWERIAWECSLFAGSTTQTFPRGKYFSSPKPSCDQSLSADLSYNDHVVQETVSSSSRHSVDIEDLDAQVQGVKLDKECLLKAFEEVHSLRLETEKEEVAAQRAKTEAANGGLDVLVKVDEMRQKVAQAKADNEMRAGEIYGEKAVLSTEAKELSSRLTQATLEQMKALNLLNEIRSTLSKRLEIANQERHCALEEKMQKERDAQDLLNIEIDSMENVSHYSKDLDAEAEACTRLRDFLINRGSIVDSLQGEMSVLLEDVENLKKQIDEGILLSSNRSLNMSRMSHLAEEFVCSSSRSRQGSVSQDSKRTIFSQVESNTQGSTTVLAGSGSSSSKSLTYFVSRTSSCFNSDDTASVHSAIGFEDSGCTTEVPVAEDKDTKPVDSALCTDYFSPNNSIMEITSEGATPHDLDRKKVNCSNLGNPDGENKHDQCDILQGDITSQPLVKVASNVSDDLQGWHVEAGDDDWHMLRTVK